MSHMNAFRWARAKVFNYNKNSVGRVIAFGCATRCHPSVHSLAMPRSGPDDASHGGGGAYAVFQKHRKQRTDQSRYFV